MVTRAVLGTFSGVQRLRVSRPGFDALDTGLSPIELAFDSTWTSMIQVLYAVTAQSAGSKTSGFGLYKLYDWTPLTYVPVVLLFADDGVPAGYAPFIGNQDWIVTSSAVYIDTPNTTMRLYVTTQPVTA